LSSAYSRRAVGQCVVNKDGCCLSEERSGSEPAPRQGSTTHKPTHTEGSTTHKPAHTTSGFYHTQTSTTSGFYHTQTSTHHVSGFYHTHTNTTSGFYHTQTTTPHQGSTKHKPAPRQQGCNGAGTRGNAVLIDIFVWEWRSHSQRLYSNCGSQNHPRMC